MGGRLWRAVEAAHLNTRTEDTGACDHGEEERREHEMVNGTATIETLQHRFKYIKIFEARGKSGGSAPRLARQSPGTVLLRKHSRDRRARAASGVRRRMDWHEGLRADILACNGGDVYLTEYGLQRPARGTRLRIVPASTLLPRSHSRMCAFHSNPAFTAAVKSGLAAAVLTTPSRNVLIVPTAPFASVRDFALHASAEEFAELFELAFATRARLEASTGHLWYFETVGHDVAHLHLRLVHTLRPVYS